MRRALKRALWLVPVGVAFVDLGASVLQVQGGSMRPTLNPALHGPCDWVLVDKASIKLLRRYTRGEVVVLRAPEDPHQQIVKRLLALQGDTLLEDAGRSSAHVEVPRGRCWIEGDNPDLSTDSRSAYGPVHLGLLEGRVTHVLWPPSRAGRVAVQTAPERLLHMDDGSGLSGG